jgi:hypothetical protein
MDYPDAFLLVNSRTAFPGLTFHNSRFDPDIPDLRFGSHHRDAR